MAFPTTGLIDNFNRADEAPIASPWINSIYSGDAQMNLTTNALQRSGSGWGSAYYGGSTYGPDCENYITIAAVGGASDGLEIAVRVTNGDTSAPNGYFLHISGTNGTWQFWKMTSGTQTSVGTSVDPAFTIGVGDQIGVEVVGNTLTAYHKPSGGSWSSVFSRTDSTSPHTGAGNLGFLVQSNSWRLDDFSGGTIPTDSSHSQDVRTTGDYAFGHFAIGETEQGIGANYPFGNVHTAPTAGYITKIRAYISNSNNNNAAAFQDLRAVVYPASGGAPVNGGAVKGASTQVRIADNTAPQWVEFVFSTPVAVTAGEEVLIGLWGGDVSTEARLYEITANPTPNVNYYFNNGGYNATSPPGNWSAGGSTADVAWSLYAVYSVDQTTSDTRDARTTGEAAATVTDERDVRVTGQVDSTIAYDARLTGSADSSTTRDARLTGRADSSLASDARATGQADSTHSQDARITGRADTVQTYDVRVRGTADDLVAYDARVTGQVDSATSVDVRTYGILVSNTSFDIRVIGVPPLAPPPVGGRGAGLISSTRKAGLELEPRGGGLIRPTQGGKVGQPGGGGLVRRERHVRTS